jgi:hypothetical protein
LDKGDDTLAAAERFAMTADGAWDLFGNDGNESWVREYIGTPTKLYIQPIVLTGKYLQQNIRTSVPISQKILGKPGSRNPNLTESWGMNGHWYYMKGYSLENSIASACKGE